MFMLDKRKIKIVKKQKKKQKKTKQKPKTLVQAQVQIIQNTSSYFVYVSDRFKNTIITTILFYTPPILHMVTFKQIKKKKQNKKNKTKPTKQDYVLI